MFSIYGITTFVLALGYMFYVKKTDDLNEASLSGSQRYIVPLLCILNPVLSGFIFYYGWRNAYPQKAQSANHWSLGAFLVALIAYAGLMWTGNGDLLTSSQSDEEVVVQASLRQVSYEGASYVRDDQDFSDFCSEVSDIDPALSEATCAASDDSYAVSLSAGDTTYCISGNHNAGASTEVQKGHVADQASATCVSTSTSSGGSKDDSASESENYFE